MANTMKEKAKDVAEKLRIRNSWKPFFLSSLILYALIFTLIRSTQLHNKILPIQLLWHRNNIDTNPIPSAKCTQNSINSSQPLSLNNIFFAIAGSANTWEARQLYVKQWWRPNETKGYVWLDKPPSLDEDISTSTSPPYMIYGDTSRFKDMKFGHPFTVRIMRIMLEAYNHITNDNDSYNDDEVRWFVMADDDTVLFIDNLVDLLGNYDHNGYHYIGGISECVWQNAMHSFSMAYGGAGYAVSWPVVKAMSRILEGCINRYQHVYGSNQVTEACMKDLGVSLTKLPGFHQFDLLGDISGLLSAHPQSPLISFHHLDALNPFFPHLDRHQSLRQIMKAASVDSSRLVQQSVCYHSAKNWSLSLSWGYTVQIYETIHTPSLLQTPAQTFRPWNDKWNEPTFMFSVRPPMDRDPCMAPHVFYFDSIVSHDDYGVVSNYVRRSDRNLTTCGAEGATSADFVTRVQVVSPPTRFQWGKERKECSEVVEVKGRMVKIILKTCLDKEALNEAILYRDI